MDQDHLSKTLIGLVIAKFSDDTNKESLDARIFYMNQQVRRNVSINKNVEALSRIT